MDGSIGSQRQEEDPDSFHQSEGVGSGGRFIRSRPPHSANPNLFSIPSLSSIHDSFTPVDLGDVAPSGEKLTSSAHLTVSGGGGEGGGGRVEHVHSSYELSHLPPQGGDGGREAPMASFDMFQKAPAGTNQLFRFDSGGSTGSFVRTFYLDPPPRSHMEHQSSHAHLEQHSIHNPHHDHASHDLVPSAGHHEQHPHSIHSHVDHASVAHDRRGDAYTLDESRGMIQDLSRRPSEMPPTSAPSSSSSSGSLQTLLPSQSLAPSSLIPSPSTPSSSSSSSAITLSTAINAGCGHQYVDITEYLNMPQYVAARKLGIPASTLSKRWKEAVRTRKWPFRSVQKLDKEITTLLHNVPQGPDAPPLPKDIEQTLGMLLRKRQEELSQVIVRI